MNDLLGDVITAVNGKEPNRKPTVRKGYAAIPGTGPAGETCKTCTHAVGTGNCSKVYHKCYLMKAHWTGGQGTDILLKSPACRNWVKDVEP